MASQSPNRPVRLSAHLGWRTIGAAALLCLGACGGDGQDSDAPVSPDEIQRESLEKVWNTGGERAQRIICKQFMDDPVAFSRDFTTVGEDRVVREFFEGEC
jgi:hypothetical protein